MRLRRILSLGPGSSVSHRVTIYPNLCQKSRKLLSVNNKNKCYIINDIGFIKRFNNMLSRHNSRTAVDLNDHAISETWLQTVLLQYYSKNNSDPKVKINSFKMTNGSDSSDSVLSDIIALSINADVNDEKKVLDLIIKFLPLNPFSRYFVQEAEFDLREIKFYNEIVPDLVEFQRSKLKSGSSSLELPVPMCYLAKYVPMDFSETPPTTPNEINESIIVLEDLKKKGYQNVSFQKGLNLEQAECAFKAVSRLHALSLAAKVNENKPLNEKYDFLFQTEKVSMSYQQLMERGLPQLINFLDKRDDMKDIVECLRGIRAKTRHLTQTLLNPKEPFSLLTHNDFWSNNLLFKDNECLILDWQMVTYSRPTNDLALLLITSLPADVRRQTTSHLLDLYWQHLVENSQNLGLDIRNQLKYNRDDLNEDYRSSQLLALLLSIGSIDVAFRDSEIEERLIAVLFDLYEDGILSADFFNQL